MWRKICTDFVHFNRCAVNKLHNNVIARVVSHAERVCDHAEPTAAFLSSTTTTNGQTNSIGIAFIRYENDDDDIMRRTKSMYRRLLTLGPPLLHIGFN